MTTGESKEFLFATSLVRLEHVHCQRALRGLSCEECKSEHLISIPLSGANVRHVEDKTYTISPAHVTFSNRGEAYRVSHPYGSGETQLNITVEPALLLEILSAQDPTVQDRVERPFIHRQRETDAAVHFWARLMSKLAMAPSSNIIEIEQATLDFVEHIAGANRTKDTRGLSARDSELAQHVRGFIATNYAMPLTLQLIARHVGLSVYRLCHVFRRATGVTLWSHIRQVRAVAALSRLAANERDFSSLALDLGFSHHSHFTAAFRRVTGRTPSQARELFRTGRASQLRDLLEPSASI